VSKDKKQIMAIGKPSAVGEAHYGYTLYKSVFVRKCPLCGSNELYWGYMWNGNFPCTKKYNNGSAGRYEGHIYCDGCDADFSCIDGKNHVSSGKPMLTRISGPVKSSEEEANKLKSGKYDDGSDTAVSSDSIFQDITNEAFRYRYQLGGGSSSWATMQKVGYGDCWAFSDFIFTRLKERRVGCKIVQYVTSEANNHRSVLYKDDSGNWVDFPYRQYGWGTKYNNMLNNTAGSKNGTVIASFDGVGISQGGTGTSDAKKITIGYDKDKPAQCYIEIIFSNDKINTKSYVCSFTQQANHENAMGRLQGYFINNVVKQATIDISEYLHQICYDEYGELDYYLHAIKIKASPQSEPYYQTNDSTVDESSCKMDIYGIGFNQGTVVNPADLSSCGKSIISQMESLVNDSGYLVKMEYAKHRKDDIINFMVDNQATPSFYAKEGDDNNILKWDSINYTPVSSLFNNSIYVYKKHLEKGHFYRFVNTKDSQSVLKYGEQSILQTTSETMTDKEAYYYARRKTDKYNPYETYSYTITVPFAPDIDLKDLVQVTADAKKLNTLKRVESYKLSYNVGSIPKIQTTIGLDELEPNLQLTKTLKELRESAKKESTVFSTSAKGTDNKEVYQWEH
jgi:hypothetical protein